MNRVKIKNFYSLKDTIKKVKYNLQNGRRYSQYIYMTKALYPEFLQIYKKKAEHKRKMGKRTWTDISQFTRVVQMSRKHMKSAALNWSSGKLKLK